MARRLLLLGTPPAIIAPLRAQPLPRAEAAGERRVLAVEDAVTALGVDPRAPYIGYIFSQHWAQQNPPPLTMLNWNGFASAASRRTGMHENATRPLSCLR
jgi:hypothetical protein